MINRERKRKNQREKARRDEDRHREREASEEGEFSLQQRQIEATKGEELRAAIVFKQYGLGRWPFMAVEKETAPATDPGNGDEIGQLRNACARVSFFLVKQKVN